MNETEKRFLSEVGGEALDDSGFEFEPEDADEFAPIATDEPAIALRDAPVHDHSEIGSLHCFILPTDGAADA